MKRVNSGFTLIELMVAMMIMVTLLAVGIARFSGYNLRQKNKAAIDRVRQLFQTAKSNAQAGKKNCAEVSCGGQNGICDGIPNEVPTDGRLVGWMVVFNAARNGVTLSGRCGAGPTWSLTGEERLGVTVTLNNPASRCENLIFAPDGTNSLSGGQICSVTAGTETVTVNSSGLIN